MEVRTQLTGIVISASGVIATIALGYKEPFAVTVIPVLIIVLACIMQEKGVSA